MVETKATLGGVDLCPLSRTLEGVFTVGKTDLSALTSGVESLPADRDCKGQGRRVTTKTLPGPAMPRPRLASPTPGQPCTVCAAGVREGRQHRLQLPINYAGAGRRDGGDPTSKDCLLCRVRDLPPGMQVTTVKRSRVTLCSEGFVDDTVGRIGYALPR